MATQVKSVGLQQQEEKKLIAQIEKKHGKPIDQIRQERVKRVRDAMELRVPDRVPVTLQTGVFAAKYAGLTPSTMYYDQAAYGNAVRKTLLDFDPDISGAAVATNSGLVLELLDARHQRWPGGNLPADIPYQFVEGEYMKPEEYDIFLADPSDFIMRYYFPRIYGTLAPFSEFAPLGTLRENGFTGFLSFFVRPEFKQLAERVSRAAEEQERQAKEGNAFAEQMERLGFPSQGRTGSTIGGAPLDAIADLLRGMRGIMLDMYRCPDKLIAACDKVLECRIRQAKPANHDPKKLLETGGGPLHRGSDGFMSLKQFEKFYWPGLKKSTMASIERGYHVSHFFEGIWDQRLEYLLELPKGKVVFHCEKTDVFKAKEVIGNHMCIQGGVPPTILQTGSPQDVDEYCKKLIKVVGKGGGFILGAGSAIDYAKPENIRAMVDSVKKYQPL